MNTKFSVGDRVQLTSTVLGLVDEPENYITGIVTRVESWNIYYVQWNGIAHPIGMRGDEIQEETND